MNNTEYYADDLVEQQEVGDTIIKFFEYERKDIGTYRTFGDVCGAESEINKYSVNNRLEIISVSCKEDKGIFVVFKKKA